MTAIKYIGYHGTDKERLEKIECSGFLPSYSQNTLPCDLGHGVYMYISRPEFNKECPKENAEKYLTTFKPRYINPIILEITTRIKNEKLLNLNEPANQNVFLEFKKLNLEKIKRKFSELDDSRTKRRGKADGLILELLINNMSIEVDAIIKDTYTPLDFDGYRQSNIYNGRELCLRNLKNIEKYEVSWLGCLYFCGIINL